MCEFNSAVSWAVVAVVVIAMLAAIVASTLFYQ